MTQEAKAILLNARRTEEQEADQLRIQKGRKIDLNTLGREKIQGTSET